MDAWKSSFNLIAARALPVFRLLLISTNLPIFRQQFLVRFFDRFKSTAQRNVGDQIFEGFFAYIKSNYLQFLKGKVILEPNLFNFDDI